MAQLQHSGLLKFRCLKRRIGLGLIPASAVEIRIYQSEEPETIVKTVITDENGITEEIELAAPDRQLSLTRDNIIKPYSEYAAVVENQNGYRDVDISGIEIFDGVLAIQTIILEENEEPGVNYVIPDHTLYGNYPSKIPEEEIKPVNTQGEIVLSRVVVPEYIIVHDGAPTDPTAQNYYVKYIDYIKNVACSEIYSTWPEETIRANVLAIMSFTLNRVYTEWYRSKGYEFTITSSTAFDHKWINKRDIFQPIARIVEDCFNQYLSRPNVKQPILTQYCDGRMVSCPNWMTQWGSKALGEQGYSAIEILRRYYGQTIYINTAEQISGIPSSYPGYELSVGNSGEKVRILQEQLTTIHDAYPRIPKLTADGIYGSKTRDAVKIFQEVFDLPVTGNVDFRTWYKISQIYTGVTRIGELY